MINYRPHKFVFLNGPPQSGKDTIAYMCQVMSRCRHLKFSQPLKDSIRAMFDLTMQQVQAIEADKEVPHPLLFGMSYRQAQIDMFDWMAQHCGQDVLGRIMEYKLQTMTTGTLFTVFSDCRKDYEAQRILDAFGPDNCLHVRLERSGTTWEGDNGSHYDIDCHAIKFENRFDKELMAEQVRMHIVSWGES